MKCFSSICFLFAMLLPAQLIAQVEHIWIAGDGEKIFADELNHPDKYNNYIWDGNVVQVNGLYNEVLAFQVIVESGNYGVKGIEIAVEPPINRKYGKSIGSNTLKYGPFGTIEIFSQHYIHVENPTEPNWFYGSENAAPRQMTGWIPDALIPVNANPDRGGGSIDIDSNQNQGFWIDLHLPRDREYFPEGLYEGKIQIIKKGNIIEEFPLKVNLLPEYLPDEISKNIWLFTSDVSSYYPDLSQEQIDRMLKYEGRRHRIDVAGGFEVNRSSFEAEKMNEYKSWLDGTAFTAENGYYGPAQGVGQKIFPIGMYGANVLGDDKNEIFKESDLWVNWFENNAPYVEYFHYLIDEPTENQYEWIFDRVELIKNNPGVGRNLPIFTTTGYNDELSDVIDIWAAYDGVDMSKLEIARSNGGDYWFYNGNRPRYGSVILEGEAVDFRVNSWILYKYDINTHFIWHGTHWRHNFQGPKGHLHQNMFQNPLTFISGGMNFGNGDGIIFYPGRMPYYPEEDRGLNELIPSIRLKNIRRGQQDVELMMMAEEKVGRSTVLEVISEIVPKALSDVSMDEEVPWSERGDDYEKVRDELLRLILK